MSLVNIGKREIDDITKKTALVRGSYPIYSLEDAKSLFMRAETIGEAAKMAITDGLKGKALLYAKREICGEEWNAPKLSNAVSQKWKDFWSMLNITKSNVNYLLDFAGYKEDGGIIETASHYREVKKIAGDMPIDEKYKELGGSKLKTAKDIREAEKKKESLSERMQRFAREFPEYAKEKPTVAYMGMGPELMKRLPQVTPTEWKNFYRTTAACIHPDKGGSTENMAILSTLNEMYSFIFENRENIEFNKKREKIYEEFMRG